jgi:hypothetical protein
MTGNRSFVIATVVVATVVTLAVIRSVRHSSETPTPEGAEPHAPRREERVQRRVQELDSTRRDFLKGQTSEGASGRRADASAPQRRIHGGSAGARAGGGLDKSASPRRGAADGAGDEFSEARQAGIAAGERLTTGGLMGTPIPTVYNQLPTQIDTLDIPVLSMQREPLGTSEADGGLWIFRNETLRQEVDLAWPPTRISIWARGQAANGVWPELQVSLGGTVLAEVSVNSAQDQEYTFPVSADLGPSVLEVAFVNDFWDPDSKEDRNVFIRLLTIQMEHAAN